MIGPLSSSCSICMLHNIKLRQNLANTVNHRSILGSAFALRSANLPIVELIENTIGSALLVSFPTVSVTEAVMN